MPATLQIDFAGQPLVLLGDRALYWPDQQSLVLADVHLGKDASFRAFGLPVPAGNSSKDLARIGSLLSVTGAKKLVILGDLIHSRSSHQPELAAAFGRWRAAHAGIEILLIRGNHDRRSGPLPSDWNVEQVPEPFDHGVFAFGHYPQPSDKPLLCGHVHPAIAVRDFDGSFASLPCFVTDPAQLMLPAFGSFTGGHTMRAASDRTIYAATGKSVIRITDASVR
jgi:DNA ligase-associated metallophosphoesterase